MPHSPKKRDIDALSAIPSVLKLKRIQRSRILWLATLLATVVFGDIQSAGAAERISQATCRPRSEQEEQEFKKGKEQRIQFQGQELMTLQPFHYIINPNYPPRIGWRDPQEAMRLGGSECFHVRWFDADLNEQRVPDHPGRWGAYIEGSGPHGTIVRRAMTFYCRPPGFFLYLPRDLSIPLPHQTAPATTQAWNEHADELSRAASDMVFRGFNDSEAGAILLAGLSEATPKGRAALTTESAAARNEEHHLAIKLKIYGRVNQIRTLRPPRIRSSPSTALHEGTLEQAGVRADAKAKIDAVLAAWEEDTGEPFVTLVARNGVIITHEAFGRDKSGRPITRDYRCDVGSITKTATAILFSQFLNQSIVALDDSVGTIFPDLSSGDPHVPTFRECLTHMSGLSGHGDWGGVRNAYLDNIIANGIDFNEPGKAYVYSGNGFELTAEAMELLTGKSAVRLYHDHLFEPLTMGDVPMGSASAGMQFTAREVAIIAQWIGNRGSYGDREFISSEKFEQMLPENLSKRYPAVHEVEGIGMHWMRDLKPQRPLGSKDPQDYFFSMNTLGHGSISSCTVRFDLDNRLVIAQVRKQAGPRFGDWAPRFFQAVADGLITSTSENSGQ